MLDWGAMAVPFSPWWYVAQGLVCLAIISDAISFQNKKREHILGWLVISTILISAHLFILGQVTGAILTALAGVRFLSSIWYPKKILMVLFACISITITFFTYKSWPDLLVISAILASIYATFQSTDARLRLCMVASTTQWIIFNILIFSPVAILMESIFLTSNLVGLYRFYIRKKEG